MSFYPFVVVCRLSCAAVHFLFLRVGWAARLVLLFALCKYTMGVGDFPVATGRNIFLSELGYLGFKDDKIWDVVLQNGLKK